MVERKAFLPNQNVNIVYPNKKTMIVVPNNKKNGDFYEYLSLSQFMEEHLITGEVVEGKLFLKIQSIHILYPNVEKMIVVPNHKKNEIVMIIQVNGDCYDNPSLTHFTDEL